MPSKTGKQRRFMRLCASPKGRKKAKGRCPPIEVAREFVRADEAKKRLRR